MEPSVKRAHKPNEEAEQHRTPRWVRGFIAVSALALAIIVAAMVTGGSEHGPGRHVPDTPVETSTIHVPPADHE